MSNKWISSTITILAVLCLLGLLFQSGPANTCLSPSSLTTYLAPAFGIASTINAQDAIERPWLGLGAEWDVENQDQSVPLSFTSEQLKTLFARVDYIHMPLMRSVASITWFCPQGIVGDYTFSSPLMQAWYALLDHAKASKMTVVIGTWDAGPWHATSPDYAQAMADLLHYLMVIRGYTNITYFSGVNEPDYQPNPLSSQDWQRMLKNIHASLESQGLAGRIALLGPDTNGNWITDRAVMKEEDAQLGGYEWHDYEATCCSISSDTLEQKLKSISQMFAMGDAKKKPLLLGEIGWSYQKGPGDNQMHVKDDAYGLTMADYAVQLARAGISGASAWDLDDAMHNKEWGMWDSATTMELRPWFYSWALLSRYLPAGATIYAPSVAQGGLRVLAARGTNVAAPGATGWTLVLINRHSQSETVRVNLPDAKNTLFSRYIYSFGQRSTDSSGFPAALGTIASGSDSEITTTIAANSMLLLTTFDHSTVRKSIVCQR